MTVNRDSFFSHVRSSLFRGSINQSQTDGMTAILDAWETRYPAGDVRQLAYSIATAYHETGRAMQPVREVGRGNRKSYGYVEPPYGQIYYGRGLVQLTWQTNYEKAGKLVGEDLVQFPDKALDPHVAASILIVGMQEGMFTGVGISKYINAKECDLYDARRVINGTDCAIEIAGYANSFLQALTSAPAAVA
jgi:putative chitinase